jgi:hypothetical protein
MDTYDAERDHMCDTVCTLVFRQNRKDTAGKNQCGRYKEDLEQIALKLDVMFQETKQYYDRRYPD